MPIYLENFGLDFLYDDDTMSNMIADVVKNGKPKIGYYGLPYINYHYGDIQMIVRCKKNDQEDAWVITGFDAHADSNCVWSVRPKEMDLQPPKADKLSKRVGVTNADGDGFAIINVMNADVLPCYMEDELIHLQMIALPVSVEYYPDERAYDDHLPETKDGKKFCIANGAVFPVGFMKNHMVEEGNQTEDVDDGDDDLCLIMGTVKKLNRGLFAIGGEKYRPYIECVIDTHFGELPIVHTIDQVPEDQRNNIAIGAIISVTAVLSGDTTIGAYNDGIVRDEENDLKLLRSVFCGDDPERLRGILTKDAIYHAEYNNQFYFHPDEIIDRIKAVQKDRQGKAKYYAFPATIVSIDDGDEALPYSIGKRCLVLALGEETNFQSIAFIDLNEDGYIISLNTTENPRYHFSIDPKPKRKNPFEGIKLPKYVSEPIITRARFHGIIDQTVSNEDILSINEFTNEFEKNIQEMLEAFPSAEENEKETLWANLFGYLFAKAAEMEYTQKSPMKALQEKVICNYSFNDVRKGIIRSELPPEQNKHLQDAMELGKQFYKDFKFFQEINGTDNFEDLLKEALLTVQALGKFYTQKCL